MNDYVIPLSTATLRRQIIISAVFVLLACVVVTFFFQYAVSAAPNLQRTLVLLLWTIMPALWAVGAFAAWLSHRKKSYILTKQSLVVRKSGLFGKGSEQLYGYSGILSVNSMSRRHGAYGTLELTLDQQPPLLLSGVTRPDEQARRIKKLAVEAKTQS